MKKSKKLKRKLEIRIRDWENTVGKNAMDKKAYRKPGSNK